MKDNQSVVSDGSAADSRIGPVWVAGNRQPAPHRLELIPPAHRLGVPRILDLDPRWRFSSVQRRHPLRYDTLHVGITDGAVELSAVPDRGYSISPFPRNISM